MTIAAVQTERAAWQADPAHSEIGFAVRHMMVANVKGSFKEFVIDAELNDEDLTKSKVTVEIDVASIDSRVQGRDDHLRSGDFFDVANHPKMTFVSERIERVGEDRYKIFGALAIRGVSKPVVLDAEVNGPARDPWGNERLGVTATAKIDRREWDLNWNAALETGGVLVSNEVKLAVEAQLSRAA